MNDDFDDFDDDETYCVYCFDEASHDVQIRGCCGEIHFMTGKEIKEHHKECDEIDKQMKFMHKEIQQ